MKNKKPEPLDFEELKENWLGYDTSLNDVIGELIDESGFLSLLEENSKEFKERSKMMEKIRKLIDEQLEELFKEIKQHIKSTGEFYLKYKDKPELLYMEEPEKWKEFCDELSGFDLFDKFLLKKYNDWLFKLAFKDVLEEGK